jgi:tetratricopeptide (TPR) repeat protein
MRASEIAEHYPPLVSALTKLSGAYYRAGRLSAALHILERGDELLHGPGQAEVPTAEHLRLTLAWGRILVHQIFLANHNPGLALQTLERARDLAEAAGDAQALAAVLDQLGLARYYHVLNSQQGSYDTALDYFQQALARRETIGDTRDIAESLFHVGLIYERRDQVDAAHAYYKRSLGMAEQHDHALEQSYALRHLGGVAEAAGDLDTALTCFQRSLTMRQSLDYTVLLPLALTAVGDVLLAKGDVPGALVRCQRAADLAAIMETPLAEIISLLSLGAVQRALAQRDDARRSLERALAIARDIGHPTGTASAEQALASLSESAAMEPQP